MYSTHEGASGFSYESPQQQQQQYKQDEHYNYEEQNHEPVHYSFQYSVNDPHTHDIKEHKEERNGDVVKGYYSLVEPDGTRRIVEYTADKHKGFNAVVRREHSNQHHGAQQNQFVQGSAKTVTEPIGNFNQAFTQHNFHN